MNLPSATPPIPPPSSRFQFSLAWLVFWTLVCACAMSVAREFLARGERGLGYLMLFGALAVWFAVLCLAIYRVMFHRRRWQKASQHREALRQMVNERRRERKQGVSQPRE